MNITKAIKTAKAVQANVTNISQSDMQASFDRLSKPDQVNSILSSDLRSVLWNTNQVVLDN